MVRSIVQTVDTLKAVAAVGSYLTEMVLDYYSYVNSTWKSEVTWK